MLRVPVQKSLLGLYFYELLFFTSVMPNMMWVTVTTDVSGRKLHWEPETWEFVEEIVGDFKF